MDKETVINLISKNVRLIRLEKGYSQEEMATVLGISKKTLVQVEKERTSIGWTNAVVVCALFKDSQVLKHSLGEEPFEVIEILAHDNMNTPKVKTLGGKMFWNEIAKKGKFRVQQNVISQHFRILDDNDYRWYSTFEEDEVMNHFHELVNE
ncbi:helix-turn-helix transcriptional regulator [Bacillus sp. BD59S]|uniref:helix-turn-helix transcriptional regulator n=1 Tax=Bacillus sp. BD59S TaxID=2499213 RepID=UPI000B438A07|nr:MULTISPECIES: helix-turn-helix transcriptional regulator [Bacillus]MBH0349600.1 XRE family transcriptional regulator [Bacillus thuringiensis]MDA2165184.1 helix-turn-helix transcriptional regulator [Bacillus cereus]OTY02224.1 transcriptional regulator [Bacillus thuringiensis serovar muju]QDQ06949.1 XRE family transcriptional regulator [Bacillus sp. BD59S]